MRKNGFILAIIAIFVVALFGCKTVEERPKTAKGAAIGAAAGAAAGAVIGKQQGETGKGAAIGAVAGAAIGAGIGAYMDKQQRELEQIPGVEVERPSEEELNVVVTSDILFDFDSSQLRPEARAALRDMGGVFQRYPETTIVVEGHTDSVGNAQYNQRLSERRANSVESFLVDQGVSPRRIVSRGYGESQPKASNATAEGRQLNRRVELNVRAAPAS